MTNYTKTTDFAAKDSLPSGDSGKIIRGTEFETEFDNIATAVNSKSDANNPTFTGTVTIDGLTVNGNTVLGNAATDTVTVTADIASNLLPSADDTYNLGAVGAEWNDLFIDGVANIDSLVANTADINGGTVDGVTIGGSSAGAITGTTITGTSFVTSGDMTFGDNDKAIFGAGSDLQIYHSGSYSVIEDSGTGNLFIKGSNLSLRDADGNDFITMVDGGAGGTVSLLHLGSPKLATTLTGINVNGSVSADGLTVDGSSSGDITLTGASASNTGLFVRDPTATAYGAFFGYDDANTVVSIGGVTNGTKNTAIVIGRDSNYVGIGTDSPNRELTIGDGTSSPNIRLLATTAGNSKIEFGDTDNGDVGQIQYVHSADYMQFTTAGAERLRIDASGRVGINTSAQDRTLHVRGSVTFESTTGNGAFLFVPTDTVNRIYSRAGNQSTTALPIAFNQGSAEAMRIDSSGNVGIGGSTPSEKLEVSNGSAADSGEISIKLGGDVDNNARTMTITKDTSTPYNTIINTQNNTGVNTGSLIFKNGATEQMRIDSAGNVGIGTSSPSNALTVVDSTSYGQLRLSSSDSDATIKYSALSFGQYAAAEEGYAGILGFSNSTENRIAIGGSTGLLNAATAIQFFTAASATTTTGSEAMRIDSSQNLLVGKSASLLNTVGSQLQATGLVRATTDGSTPLQLNRKTSDGTIAEFYKDGGIPVGSVGTNSGSLFIGSGDTGLNMRADLNAIYPWGPTGGAQPDVIDLGYSTVPFKDLYLSGSAKTDTIASPSSSLVLTATDVGFHLDSTVLRTFNGDDATVNLGSDAARFKDLYLSGGAYLGGVAAANKLDDYEEGTWTPVFEPTTGSFTTMTMDVVEAKYTKIGNAVTISVWVRTDNVDTTGASGALRLAGLPFNSNSYSSMAIGNSAGWGGDQPAYAFTSGTGSDYITLQYKTAINAEPNNVATTDLQTGAVANQNQVFISGTYFTTS